MLPPRQPMHHLLEYVLWAAGPVAQIALLAIMGQRKLRKEFPVFFSYTVFCIISTVALFFFYRSGPAAYFSAYWTSSGLSMLFGLAVIHEIFVYSFRPYSTLMDFGRLLFRWAAAVVTLVAIIMALGSHSSAMSLLLEAILVTGRSVRVMQCGLVLLLILFASHLGLSWRSRVFGIALGFGCFSAVELISFTLRARFGYIEGVNTVMSIAAQASYLCAIALWTTYMLAPEPARKELTYLPQSAQWNFALGGVAHSTAGGPLFLTNVESTVERIMAQRLENGADGEAAGSKSS